jgi:hypothetical protein
MDNRSYAAWECPRKARDGEERPIECLGIGYKRATPWLQLGGS